jgi:hypothetical protein
MIYSVKQKSFDLDLSFVRKTIWIHRFSILFFLFIFFSMKEAFISLVIATVIGWWLYVYFTQFYEGEVSFQAQSMDISDENNINFAELKPYGSIVTKIQTIDTVTTTSKSLKFVAKVGNRMADALKSTYTTVTCQQSCPSCAVAQGCDPLEDGTCSSWLCDAWWDNVCDTLWSACVRIVQ